MLLLGRIQTRIPQSRTTPFQDIHRRIQRQQKTVSRDGQPVEDSQTRSRYHTTLQEKRRSMRCHTHRTIHCQHTKNVTVLDLGHIVVI